MWIRNQDRDELVNSDIIKNIFIEKLVKLTNPKWSLIADEITLGTYTSEENAIDALAYIHECIYLGKNEMFMPIEENGELKC